MIYYETELYHHGVKGMKWGVRRYQNKDGSRTPLGKKRERQENSDNKTKKVIAGISAGAAGVGVAAGIAIASKNSRNSKNTKNNKNGVGNRLINSKWNEQSIKGGKNKPNKSPSQVVFEEGGKSFENASSILKEITKYRKKPNRAAGMSDKELRERVNRIRLENEYNKLTESDTNKGLDYTISALNVLGSLAAIGASSAVIIGAVKGVRDAKKATT